ncbi:DUF6624 domain-containing protein [Winogradskyella sp.]|uniref:DUF6624 domain-containing protein n=1 Tax=Winogradskyella sp. TaxID=1883156 RepID=UPI0025D0AC8B|nr:DUF6624 domain-containing protein [Winogradskyella sp.]MBT8244906.1 hypothetical protein [Winogradskyella sp.]
MKKIIIQIIVLTTVSVVYSQDITKQIDSLKNEGLLMAALQQQYKLLAEKPSEDLHYDIASTYALLWSSQARDSAFVHLHKALKNDASLQVLYDPHFLSLIEDERWLAIENSQLKKYEIQNNLIQNKSFALKLFRMIIKDQGFMYVGNIERKKYMKNGGYFSTPAIYPILAMEEKNHNQNTEELLRLLDENGWPTASQVTEYAAAGAALIINHTNYKIRKKYFPMLEAAFKKGEAQPLRYAKMKDRLLIEEGKEQL